MSSIFLKPSFYALFLTGIIYIIIIIVIIKNYKKIQNYSIDKIIILFSIIGILIGVHGLLHLGLESIYNFNPLINKIN